MDFVPIGNPSLAASTASCLGRFIIVTHLIATIDGFAPTDMLAKTVLLAVSITDTLFASWLAT